VKRVLFLTAVFVLFFQPGSAFAQRFGGQFGGAGGFWMLLIDPGVPTGESFGRNIGEVLAFGGRGWLQTGKIRLGGGAFGGGFTDEGLNEAGNEVGGGLAAGGFTAEYLVIQRNVEVIAGALFGGGVVTIEERLGVTGDVEQLLRRQTSFLTSYPWVRVGYNPAALVNVGLELGYMFGTNGVGGPALGLDVMIGLIP
jgi:hypothetical protein